MTTSSIKGVLQAAIFGGALALLPAAASAESGAAPSESAGTPDHAQAEARTGAETTVPTAEKTEGAPDHAQAEARSDTGSAVERDRPTPDHAAAEHAGEAQPR